MGRDVEPSPRRRHAVEDRLGGELAFGELAAVRGRDGPQGDALLCSECVERLLRVADGACDEQRLVREEHCPGEDRRRLAPKVLDHRSGRAGPRRPFLRARLGGRVRRRDGRGLPAHGEQTIPRLPQADVAAVGGVRIAPKTVDGRRVEHKEPSGGHLAGGPRPTAPAGLEPPAIDPVRPVPPRAVEETGRAEQVRLALPLGDALEVELHLPHEDERAVAGEDVGQRPARHVRAADDPLRLEARLGVAAVDRRHGQLLPRLDVDTVQADAAVDE